MTAVAVPGISILHLGTHERPEKEMATTLLQEMVVEAGIELADIDGLYMSEPRPWTRQGFFTTYLINRLGLDVGRNLEVYTGGSSASTAMLAGLDALRQGDEETIAVIGVERQSTVDTERFYDLLLKLFDTEFHSPIGPTTPGIYAQSLQRYLHENDIDREDVASIVRKNRVNGAKYPETLFDSPVTIDEILNSEMIADPLRMYECPAPVDGAAGILLSRDPGLVADEPARLTGMGYHHATSHFGQRDTALTEFPAPIEAMEEAFNDAGVTVDDVDLFEPEAPFPHIEALYTEQMGFFDVGDGAAACRRGETEVDGTIPVSASGGCIGRGHPGMVTPMLNYVEAVRQLRGTAANQVEGVDTVLTSAGHGHGGDGASMAIFERRE